MPVINFSRLSAKSRVGQVVRMPLRMIPANTQVVILQGPLRGQKWIAGSSVANCWLGSYELEKQRVFEQVVRPGDVVFDIGAHAGFYTLLASRLVQERGQVFAFEPAPSNQKFLREHVRLNHLTNVTIFNLAVSDRSGVAMFENGNNTYVGHLSEQGEIQVQVKSLDQLVASGEVPPPNVLKIDVEGAEVLVLKGAVNELSQHHPKILLATHSRALTAECIELLAAQGYALQSIEDATLEETTELLAI